MSGTKERGAVQEHLVTTLSSAIKDPLGPARNVYGYVKGDLDVDLPALVVAAAGAGVRRGIYYYDLLSFVPVGVAGSAYTEQDSEDDVNAMADALLEWIENNQVHRHAWDSIEIIGRSTVSKINLGGQNLWLERFSIEVLVV